MTSRSLDDEAITAPRIVDAWTSFIDHSDASSSGNEVNVYFEFPGAIVSPSSGTEISVENAVSRACIPMILFLADNLQEKLRLAPPLSNRPDGTEEVMCASAGIWRVFEQTSPNRMNAVALDVSRSTQQNATDIVGTSLDTIEKIDDIYDSVRSLFAQADEEQFEDGMESDFSRGLVALLWRHGDEAAEAIGHLITRERVNPEIAAEALRWLGRLEQAQTYRYRRWILEQALNCSAAIIRDGAILGLASMDDIHAKPYLERAVAKEECPELRDDMLQAIEELGE